VKRARSELTAGLILGTSKAFDAESLVVVRAAAETVVALNLVLDGGFLVHNYPSLWTRNTTDLRRGEEETNLADLQ